MRTLLNLALASAIAATAPAMAQSQPATSPPSDETVSVRAPQIIELPRQLNQMWPNEFEEISGIYTLSNGKHMVLSMDGTRMYATIDGGRRTRIVAESPYVFIARDKQFKIVVMDPALQRVADADLRLIVPTSNLAVLGTRYVSPAARR
ncbi:MAG TPA: hypothetical protein VIT92_13525 [Burkholderiaceae bacterium]